MRSQDQEQPDDDVDDRNARKESRYTRQHIMEDGQELEVLVVDDLLVLRRFHGQQDSEITRVIKREEADVGLIKVQLEHFHPFCPRCPVQSLKSLTV